MDYFSVIVLVIVAFIFVSDRNIKSIENIQQNKSNINIEQEVNNIKQELIILNITTKEMNYCNLLNLSDKCDKQYILLKNIEIQLCEQQINTLIANYINLDKKPCGFNLLYTYQDEKWSLKKLYLDIINYLNIFNKKELNSYGIIICEKNDLLLDEKHFKNEIVSYIPSEITDIEYTKNDINSAKLKNIYYEKITTTNVEIVVKIILLIISGSIITTNLIYSILNINNNINGLIISVVIYYCYSYIIRYVYKPIGKKRIIASYVFPIYFISYVFIGSYTWLLKVIKNVQAS